MSSLILALLLLEGPSPTPWPRPEQMEPMGKSPAQCASEREALPRPKGASIKGRATKAQVEALSKGWRETRSRYYLSALYEHHIVYLRPGEPAAPLLALLGDRTKFPWADPSDTDYRYDSHEPPFCQPIQLMVLVDKVSRVIQSYKLGS